MRRRQYLTAAAVASTAGLAGCSGILGGGGGGPSGAAKSWLQAANNGNEDKVEDLTHSDSRLNMVLTQIVASFESQDFSVDSVETTEEGDEEATVEAEVTASADGESATSTSEMQMKTEDGDWKVLSFGDMGGNSGTSGTSA